MTSTPRGEGFGGGPRHGRREEHAGKDREYPWLTAGQQYGRRWEQLIRLALGPLADDATAMTVIRAVLHPRFYEDLRAGGRSTEAVAALVAAIVTPWFGQREHGR